MSGPSLPPSLHELGERIAKARRERDGKAPARLPADRMSASGLGLAARISIEIVTAVAVSTGLGWLLDQWWGTTPWMMLLFLFLGFAAGLRNAVRAAERLDAAVANAPGKGEAAAKRSKEDGESRRGG